MSNRFITESRDLSTYSPRRVLQMINEADFEPHRMRPYGMESGKFTYRSMWEHNGNRPGNRRVRRAAKKAARRENRKGDIE